MGVSSSSACTPKAATARIKRELATDLIVKSLSEEDEKKRFTNIVESESDVNMNGACMVFI